MEESKKPEVIDLADSGVTCDMLPEFSIKLSSTVFGLLEDETPFLCGGNDGLGDCFMFDKVTGGFNPIATRLLEGRFWAAAAVINNGKTLFVTGGTNGDVLRVNSTEYVTPFQETVKGPDLPVKMDQHCIVNIDDRTLLFMGGTIPNGGFSLASVRVSFSCLTFMNSKLNSFQTWFFDIEDEVFTPGPDMLSPRAGFGCAKFTTSDEREVVVAAGELFDKVDSEFLFLDEPDTWHRGPDLPLEDNQSAKMVPSPDGKGVVYIGGLNNKNLYELRCVAIGDDDCQWTKMEQELQFPRDDFAVFYIPNDYVHCRHS